MRSALLKGICLVVLVVGLSAPLGAQGSVTGNIRGTVTGPEGGALAGVTVTATSDALVAGRLTTVTDERGLYRFPSLPPGTYVLEATLEGMKKARREGVRITVGLALAVDLEMTMAEAEGEIVVTGEAPLVSVVS
ncbi:MAG: carboxypeptidase regulatory-like domain-containing protein, partial [Acidobacteriota bacterium]